MGKGKGTLNEVSHVYRIKLFTTTLVMKTSYSSVIHVRLISIISVLFVTDICLLFGIICVCFSIGNDVNEVPEMTYDIPCDNASLSTIEDLEMTKNVVDFETKGGINFCKFKYPTYVVDKVSERIQRQRVSKGKSGTRFISCGNPLAERPGADSLAYFTVLNIQPNTSDARTVADTVLQWDHNPDVSYIGKDFSYSNGRIRVNMSDFYFVYASLVFKEGTKIVEDLLEPGNINGRLMTFVIAIFKQDRMYQYTAETRLLDNVVPVCTSNDNGVWTVHIGTHIFLRKSDEVFIKVVDTHRLIPESAGNKFGIFLLD